MPREQTRTRSARWGQRAPNAVLFEALGDLWVGDGESAPIQLTSTPEHETNPVFDPVGRRTLFARWSDAEQGAIFELVAAGGVLRKLTDVPSQYGSIAVSPADGALAWVRGANDLATGTKLESQTAFELVHYDAEGNTTVVTKLAGNSNRYARRPPTVRFSPDGDELYFTEFVDDTLTLVRIRRDGENRRELYTFPHATRAVVSPDFEWIAFREYHRTFVTPLEFAGEAVHISAADKTRLRHDVLMPQRTGTSRSGTADSNDALLDTWHDVLRESAGARFWPMTLKVRSNARSSPSSSTSPRPHHGRRLHRGAPC